MTDKVICKLCGLLFIPQRDKEWNEEIARKEFEEIFPDTKWEDRVVVCESCYEMIKPNSPWYNKDVN